MKETKITPGSNLMWEASRIILPEHKEAILEHRRKQRLQPRPQLDEQEIEKNELAIHDSYEQQKPVTITKYTLQGNVTITGIVEKVDTISRQIKIDGRWIFASDIINVD